MNAKRRRTKPEVVGLLGIGLDGDGHRRVTECDHFLLVGGSAETHERLQDTALRFNDALERRGKRLRDAAPEEVADLLREAREEA